MTLVGEAQRIADFADGFGRILQQPIAFLQLAAIDIFAQRDTGGLGEGGDGATVVKMKKG